MFFKPRTWKCASDSCQRHVVVAAPLLVSRVRHTDRSLNAPKGILPCLWVANSRSRQARRPVGKLMTLIFRQSHITLATNNSRTLSDAYEKFFIFVDNELKDVPYAIPDWNTEF